jgi:hypothetical protein
MKTHLTKFMAAGSVALLMLSACKKNDAIVTSNGGKAGALTATASTLPLDKTKINDATPVISFSFTAANYGFSAAVTNTLQIDPAGDNWKNPMSVTLGNKVYSEAYSTSDFNSLMLKLNLPAGVASQVQVRIQHTISASVAPVYSNVLSLSVTPYNLKSWVYVPGSYEGWGNPGAAEDSLLSATDNGIYTGIINFSAGNYDFLIVPVKGSWANKYATTAGAVTSGTTATYPTQYVTGGDNNFFAPPTPGQYVVTLNTNTSTLTIEPADFYTIIGSAPPGPAWSNDYAMKYLNDGSGNWIANGVPMVVGEYKFRQDDQWTYSWGPTDPDGSLTDIAPKGDGNIAIAAAGNYNFTFFMPATVSGTKPVSVTTYTAAK